MRIEVGIPDGEHGNARITTFEVTKEGADFHNMRCLMKGQYYRQIVPGTYKRLTIENELVMTNTPAEVRDHTGFIHAAQRHGGDILINGLGLGMVLKAILEFDNVTSVTVIEKSEDVIALTGPSFISNPRVVIVHADALEWKAPKGKRYSVVWHDIWNSISADNLPTMAKLHRKYGGRCDWQSSWGRKETHALREGSWR